MCLNQAYYTLLCDSFVPPDCWAPRLTVRLKCITAHTHTSPHTKFCWNPLQVWSHSTAKDWETFADKPIVPWQPTLCQRAYVDKAVLWSPASGTGSKFGGTKATLEMLGCKLQKMDQGWGWPNAGVLFILSTKASSINHTLPPFQFVVTSRFSWFARLEKNRWEQKGLGNVHSSFWFLLRLHLGWINQG